MGVGAQRGPDVGVADGLTDGLDVRATCQGVRGDSTCDVDANVSGMGLWAVTHQSPDDTR
jgi:hypothetical protein